MFFEEVKPPPPADAVFSNIPSKMLQYICKTRKSLEMSRVFINRKKKDIDETHKKSEETHQTECVKENEVNSNSQEVSRILLIRICI